MVSIRMMAQDVIIDAALATTIQNSLNAGIDYPLTATGNIIVSANILKNAGTAATLTLKATQSITFSSAYSISSSSDALNIVFWSRSDGNNAGDDSKLGSVWLPLGSSVNTNGGNVVIGGGADPSIGYCLGDNGSISTENNARWRGITINGTLAAGGGNIVITGRGCPGGSSARGVSIGGSVSTSGSGLITINGKANVGSDGLAFGDASVSGTTGTLTSGSGTVTLNGNKDSGSNGVNLAPYSGATAYINCGGNLSITSTGNISASSGYLIVSGASSFSAGTSSITLSNTNNDFTGNLSVPSGTNLTIVDKNALSLGTISISALLSAQTLSGNLSINNTITTTYATYSAIKLYADYNKTAGDATGGNILVNGSPAISTGSGGRAALYTGSISGSTGLSGIISDSRYLSDATTVTYYPALGTGVYGIYREAGSLTCAGATGTDWNTASNWNSAVSPNSTFNITIPVTSNNPIVNQDVTSPAVCNNLTIQSGAVLTIAPVKGLTVNGTLTNSAGNSGLLIQSTASGNGSLIHNTAAVNATIQRYITGSTSLSAMTYHLVSVPIAQASSPTSNLFLDSYLYYFDETQNSANNGWVNMGTSTTNPLTVTRGYMVYYQAGSSTTYSFTGPMNNGSFTATTSYTSTAAAGNQGFNLVPNPYPSAINWRAASGWSRTNIDSAIYIWNSSQSTKNYASYVSGSSINGGSQFIAVGQSFFVHANNASPVLSMNNSVRLHNTVSFLKNDSILPSLLKIHADAGGASDEIVVRFADGATEGFDGEWDAYKMTGGADAPQFSSLTADGISLAINSLPLGAGEVVVPLNFSFSASSDVTFTASSMESFKPSTTIYLEDKGLSKMINLKQEPVYTFSYQAGSAVDRFNLHFNGLTGISENNTTVNSNAFISNGLIYLDVPSMQGQLAEITVYNMLGQVIRSQEKTVNGIISIEAPWYRVFTL